MGETYRGTVVTDDVFATLAEGVLTITLNRPSRRNAMSDAMNTGLAELLAAGEGDDSVGAIVLTGAGQAFCSGGDVQQFNADGGEGQGSTVVDERLVALQQQLQRDTVGRLYRMRKPVLASLPGAAAGAGLGLALAADLRIGSERAVMATAFGAVGLSGDFGVAWSLQRLVGPARAREMLFLSTKLTARDCRDAGLLNWLVAEDELVDRTREVAEELARGPRSAIASMKQNLIDARELTLEAAMDIEVVRHKETGLTEDHLGAIEAFVDKRKPVFGKSSH